MLGKRSKDFIGENLFHQIRLLNTTFLWLVSKKNQNANFQKNSKNCISPKV